MAPETSAPAGDQGGAPSTTPPAPPAGDPPADDGLGEAGKRALEAERGSRRAAENRAKELEKELTRHRESSMSEQEKAVAAAKREGHQEATAAFNTRLVQAEVRAAAAGKLADPEDAVLHLNLDEFAIGDNGEIDKKAITNAIERLVKAKPYLAASATRPSGDADQGVRGNAASDPDEEFGQLMRNRLSRR